MDEKKAEAYKQLVKKMLDRYPKYDFNNPENNTELLYAPYVDENTYCQEINFYTYWQGLGYAERTPKIKYLFVSQDWGSFFDDSEGTKDFIERLKKMNAGDRSVSYINDRFNESETDKNLILLFEDFGYDLYQRYDELFFTNFCLGCRRDSSVGMHRHWMSKDADPFKQLYDILEPENIITMGMRTFECVYRALTGKDYPGLGSGNFANFKKLVSNRPQNIFVKRGNQTVHIYPIHHCGRHGIENLLADPLDILRSHLWFIKEKRQSPFAKYLFKLINEYKAEHNGEAPEFDSDVLPAKVLSDLRCGTTNAPSKKNVIAIIFMMRLSADVAYQLLAKANYTRSRYSIPKKQKALLLEGKKIDKRDRLKRRKNLDDMKFYEICIRYIDKQNFNRSDIDEELDDCCLDCVFSKNDDV